MCRPSSSRLIDFFAAREAIFNRPLFALLFPWPAERACRLELVAGRRAAAEQLVSLARLPARTSLNLGAWRDSSSSALWRGTQLVRIWSSQPASLPIDAAAERVSPLELFQPWTGAATGCATQGAAAAWSLAKFRRFLVRRKLNFDGRARAWPPLMARHWTRPAALRTGRASGHADATDRPSAILSIPDWQRGDLCSQPGGGDGLAAYRVPTGGHERACRKETRTIPKESPQFDSRKCLLSGPRQVRRNSSPKPAQRHLTARPRPVHVPNVVA